VGGILSLLFIFHSFILCGYGFLSRGFTDRHEILHGGSAISQTGLLLFLGDSPRDGRAWASTGAIMAGYASCWSTCLFTCIFILLGVHGELRTLTEVAKNLRKTPYSRSRSFKVIEFVTSRKGMCDFLLVLCIIDLTSTTCRTVLELRRLIFKGHSLPVLYNALARGDRLRIWWLTLYIARN